PRLYRLYHLPKMGDADWVAADLLSPVLSGDKASRLEKALVLAQQIATDVAAYVLPTEATGMLLIQATAKDDVPVEQVEGALDDRRSHARAGAVRAAPLPLPARGPPHARQRPAAAGGGEPQRAAGGDSHAGALRRGPRHGGAGGTGFARRGAARRRRRRAR